MSTPLRIRSIIKAIVHDTYGSPDVLELKDIDKPPVGDHDVLVRVDAAGVNMGVWHLMTGQVPEAIRYLEEGHARGEIVITAKNRGSSYCQARPTSAKGRAM